MSSGCPSSRPFARKRATRRSEEVSRRDQPRSSGASTATKRSRSNAAMARCSLSRKSASRNAIGTGVAGGMIAATALGIFLIPVFFVVVRRVFKAPVNQSPNQKPPAGEWGSDKEQTV